MFAESIVYERELPFYPHRILGHLNTGKNKTSRPGQQTGEEFGAQFSSLESDIRSFCCL